MLRFRKISVGQTINIIEVLDLIAKAPDRRFENIRDIPDPAKGYHNKNQVFNLMFHRVNDYFLKTQEDTLRIIRSHLKNPFVEG
jgi:hypothetical protein